jgi:hypothetical protein
MMNFNQFPFPYMFGMPGGQNGFPPFPMMMPPPPQQQRRSSRPPTPRMENDMPFQVPPFMAPPVAAEPSTRVFVRNACISTQSKME